MKQITISVEDDKVDFFLELIDSMEGVYMSEEPIASLHTFGEQKRGIYDAIISLQQGKGIPSSEDNLLN